MTGVIDDWEKLSSNLITWNDEEQIAAEGQTIYTLTQGVYTPSANMMEVYLNGLAQPQAYYAETDKHTITLAAAPEAGTKVRFRYAQVFAAENAASTAQLTAVRAEIAGIGLIKSIQRGVTNTAATVTIDTVDMSKAVILSVSKGSAGYVAARGIITLVGDMGRSASTFVPYKQNGATDSQLPDYNGSISGGSTDLTTKQYSAQLISETQIQSDGAVEWQVIEFR